MNSSAQLNALNGHRALLNVPSHAEIAAHAVQQFSEQLFAGLPYPAFILSAAGYIQNINQAMLSVLGLPREQLLKRPISDIVESASQPMFERLIHAAYDYPGSPQVGEITLYGAERNQVLVRFNVLTVPQSMPPLVMAIGQPLDDWLTLLQEVVAISIELEARNAQLEELNAQLHKSEQQRKHVTNLLIHDIRSPLVATSASLEIVQRSMKSLPMQPFLSEAVEAGLRSLRTVIDLTNDIMDMKKLEAGHRPTTFDNIDFYSFCAEIKATLQALSVQQHVTIQIDVVPSNLAGTGDRRLLERVVLNLLSNALRFTPASETITIQVRQESDDHMLLVVADRGPGVAPGERERIFEPFVQGQGDSKGGTGLGLAFCREVVHAHDGHIWVEDNPGGGSRFCIRLPQRQDHGRGVNDVTAI
jgi:signal transduction histidine kinase